ncbi:MAG: alpha/beta fold hydrolase [Acidobacteriota bacterium]
MKRFLISLAAVAIFACASDPAKKPGAAGASPADGEPSPVGVIPTTLLHDAQRNKDLDVSISYPTRGGPFPVIIFSHGYGSSNRAYEPLVAHWTSHGYVVIRPAHADAGALREALRDRGAERREEQQQGRRERRKPTPEELQQQAQFRPNPSESIWEKEREPQWRDRARDVALVIDSLGDLETRFPELKGKIDAKKIGVGGHSYGAFTALLLAGMKTSGNPPLQLADPRVNAVLAMSPQGIAANRGLTAESWRDVKTPAMFMTGTRDFGAAEIETPLWRRDPFEHSPAGDKYYVLIEGARHITFAGIASTAAPEADLVIPEQTVDPVTGQRMVTRVPRSGGWYVADRGLHERIRSIALTFWDAYLKSDAKAKEKLSAGQFGGNVTVEKK